MRTKILLLSVSILFIASLPALHAEVLKVSGYASTQQAIEAGWRTNSGGTLSLINDSTDGQYLEARGAVHHGGIVWMPRTLSLDGAKKIRFKIRQNVSPMITFTWLVHFKNTRKHIVRVLPRGAGYQKWQQIDFDITQDAKGQKVEVLDIGMYSNEFKDTKDGYVQVADMEIVYDKDDSPVYSASFMQTPPAIDGKINTGEWAMASELTGFVSLLGNMAERQTRVWMGHDNENLYFAFKSPYESAGPPKTGKSGRLQRSDWSNGLAFIEIWLRSEKAGFFKQYCFNLAGGLLSQTFWPSGCNIFDSTAKIACSLKPNPYQAGGTWYAEMKIPLTDLGNIDKKNNDIGVLFCRDYAGTSTRATEDWTSSLYTGGGFEKYEKYARLKFLPKNQAGFQLNDFGKLNDGDIKVFGNVVGLQQQLKVNLKVIAEGTGELCDIAQSVAVGAFEVGRNVSISSQTKTKLYLEVANPETGELVFRNSWNFEMGSPLKLFCVPRAETGQLSITVNSGHVQGADSSCKIKVEIFDDKAREAFRHEMPCGVNETACTLKTGKISPGWYDVSVTLQKGDVELAKTSNKKVWIGKAIWAENKIGITDKVPSPWTPVGVNGKNVSVIGRSIQLGDAGLPVCADTLSNPLFSSPARLDVCVDGKREKIAFLPLKLKYAKDAEAVWEICGKSKSVEIAGELKIEYDGFAWWALQVKATRKINLDSLAISFDLPNDRALYARGKEIDGEASGYSAVLDAGDGKETRIALGSFCNGAWPWTNKFIYEIFIGDDEMGLSVLTTSAKNHSGDEHVRITNKDSAREMKITLTGRQALNAGESLDYDYAWAILPLRTQPTDPKEWHVNLGPAGTVDKAVEQLDPELFRQCRYTVGGRYTRYDSHHEIIAKDPQNRRKRRAGWQYPDVQGQILRMNELGSKVTVDGIYWAAADMGAPDTIKYINEWKMIGGGATWLNYYNTFDVPACANSSFKDYMIYGAAEIYKAGINGVYLDVSAENPCSNPDHGCGWIDPKTGKRHKTINFRGIRELHKRVYTHYRFLEPKGVIFHHHLDSAAWAGFCDGGFQGEEWACEQQRPDKKYYQKMTPEYFRAMAMKQYGPPYTFFNLFAYYQVCPITEAMAICLPNKVYPAIWNERKHNWPDIQAYWKIMDPYWTDARFVGYWFQNPPASVDRKDVYVSAWCKDDSVILVVANWNYKPVKVHVSPDSRAIGLDAKSANIVKEICKGRVDRRDDGSFDVSIQQRDVVILKLVKREK